MRPDGYFAASLVQFWRVRPPPRPGGSHIPQERRTCLSRERVNPDRVPRRPPPAVLIRSGSRQSYVAAYSRMLEIVEDLEWEAHHRTDYLIKCSPRRHEGSDMYVYREFPKWVTGPYGPVIVQNAEEERRLRWERARNIGRDKANAVQRARADNLAIALAPEIASLRRRGHSFRDIADALDRRGILSARGRQWGPAQVWRLLRRAEITVATGALPAEQRPT
jgi:Recombinase